ncbi:hypothetical protein MMC29_002698 [Sticta canariensis]|nr:hypothetical protein [Sticta canariensis]
MASTNSHSYPQDNNDPQDDPQDGPQNDNHLGNDHQTKDQTIVFDPAQGQDITSEFEQCFTSMYPFQTSILSNLNHLDFKNLQLAGFRTPQLSKACNCKMLPEKYWRCHRFSVDTLFMLKLRAQGVGDVLYPDSSIYDWLEDADMQYQREDHERDGLLEELLCPILDCNRPP